MRVDPIENLLQLRFGHLWNATCHNVGAFVGHDAGMGSGVWSEWDEKKVEKKKKEKKSGLCRPSCPLIYLPIHDHSPISNIEVWPLCLEQPSMTLLVGLTRHVQVGETYNNMPKTREVQ